MSTAYLQHAPPGLFQYNQSTFQAFYFFEKIFIDSILVAPNDWVGTFNCKKWNADSTACSTLGACVGSRKYDTSKCGGGICDLPAMGDGADGKSETIGYLLSGEYPVFLIYDASAGIYYKTKAEGDVRIQKDVCRNGYPFCYGWQNQSFPFSSTLIGNEVYIDCMGKLGGDKVLDDCGICNGSGPQYKCEKTDELYCTEDKYKLECEPLNESIGE